MKISKLLSKKNLSIIVLLFCSYSFSFAEEDPVDIWNINKNKKEKTTSENITTDEEIKPEETTFDSDIYKMQPKNNPNLIELDKKLESKEMNIFGLYDPEDYGLDINLWSKSNGAELKETFKSMENIKLSKDASEILNILLLTNAYSPNQNIMEEEFFKIKSDWLIKESNLQLIEEYLIKNQIVNFYPDLARHLVDQYLSESSLEKSCQFFSKVKESINDDYLSKFNLYCLIIDKKINEAQLILDLKKESGFKDEYYEKKFNYLIGYDQTINKDISENSILDFHLAHKTISEFYFEPNKETSKLIWKYLATSNLLYNIKDVKISELDKIAKIEQMVHEKNFSEKDLFELYKRFQFDINLLVNPQQFYKTLPNIEARSLIYQKILLTVEPDLKMELIKILKESFINDNIGNAFDEELKSLLSQMDREAIPSNSLAFYNSYIKEEEVIDRKIIFNDKILHQSTLLNYFRGDYAKSEIEKDLDEFLKEIKKNKKYFFSKKDIIFLEALRSDGIKISNKYDNLYEIKAFEIPPNMESMINNKEIASVLLQIVKMIGEDKVENIDDDSMYFIINIMNQLNIDLIRNKLLFKILPLKV
ncbi:MAG: hypothetical protein EXR14_02520 [Pelagibacteraceae bacterium]|nr:hypothetical protein [Pelagibacteraceae bacterium]PHX89305.1 MAG: hypothetical protein CK535_02385 [Pelagibacteraceae bacterium]